MEYVLRNEKEKSKLKVNIAFILTFRNISQAMTTSADINHLFVMTTSNQYSKVYLHDPEYFVRTLNPVTVPNLEIELNEDFLFKNIYLQVKHVRMMNNCSNSVSHSITSCVRNYVDKVILQFVGIYCIGD